MERIRLEGIWHLVYIYIFGRNWTEGVFGWTINSLVTGLDVGASYFDHVK